MQRDPLRVATQAISEAIRKAVAQREAEERELQWIPVVLVLGLLLFFLELYLLPVLFPRR